MEALHHKYVDIVEKEEKIRNATITLKQLTNKDLQASFDRYEGEVEDTFDLQAILGRTLEQDELEMWTGSRWYLFITTDKKFEETLKNIEDRTSKALNERAKKRLDRLMALGFTKYQIIEADRDGCIEAFLPITTNYVHTYIKATFYIYDYDC